MITTKPLRVLLVEDSEQDALLIEDQIRRGGFELELKRVVNAAELRERLGAETWDLVISDHDLPGSDSGATLLALREAELDIPFLLVSGTIGEEAAVAAMKAGANDYVSKDRLGRLVPVIERELALAVERREARACRADLAAALAGSLAEAKERAREFEVLHRISVAASGVMDVARLVDMAVDGALELVGGDGALLRWYDSDKGTLRQLSTRDDHDWVRTDDLVPERSILGEAFLRRSAIVTNDYQGYDHALESHRREGVAALVAVPLLVGDRAVGALGVVGYGSRKFSQADANILSILGADVAAAIEAARLITDLEESEVRYRGLYVSSPTGLVVASREGAFLEVNPAFCTLLGYTSAELVGLGFADVTHPDDIAMSRELVTRIAAGEDNPEPITKRYLRKDGSTIWVILSVAASRDGEGRVDHIVGQVQDITERKRAEDNLADSLSLLERTQEVGDIGTFVAWLTPERAGQDQWSPMALKIYGLPQEAPTLCNDDFWARVHPDDIDRIRKSWADALAGSIYDERHRIVRPDGGVRWLHERAAVERDAAGAPLRFLGVSQDITEQHLAEEALRESEDRFRGAFSSSGVGMALSTPDGKFVQVNGAICAMLGRSEDELVGSSFRDFVVEEDVDSEKAAILQLLRGDKGFHISVHRHRHAKGHIIWGRVHLSVIRQPDRNAKYILAQVEDISAEIAAKAALLASEARNAAVIRATLDGLIVIDGASIVTEFNPAAERMFGMARELVVGHDLAETLIPERFRAAHREGIRRNLLADAPSLSRRVEMIAQRGDGSEFPVELSLSRLETAGAPFFSASLRDLTDRDRLSESVLQLAQVVAATPVALFAFGADGVITLAEGRALEALGVKPGAAVGANVFDAITNLPEAVEHVRRGLAGESFAGPIHLAGIDIWLEARYDAIRNEAGEVVGMSGMAIDISDRVRGEAARQESDAKSRLVAIVNHEVRTPLNSILGFTELLKLERVGPLNEKQIRYVTNVEMAGRHLLALVNDSLDLSKIAAGKMDLEIFDVDLAEIIDQAAGQVLPLVESRGLEIRVDAGGRLAVRADRRRLLQIMWNLLSNAIRHTATSGTITISGARNGASVDIVVTDTGVGIAADQFERIFEEYAQVGVGPDGTGLGLPVSRRLAQLMGGDIHVVSELGVGSSFTITLPAVQSRSEVPKMTEPAAALPAATKPRRRRVNKS